MNSFYQGLQGYIKDELSKLDKPNTMDEYYTMANKIHMRHEERREEKKKEKKPDNT